MSQAKARGPITMEAADNIALRRKQCLQTLVRNVDVQVQQVTIP